MTLDTPPLAFAVTIVSCFGPGRKRRVRRSALIAGTWITIVSGVLPLPGVQLTMPPFARVSVVRAPVRTSVSVTRPPVAPVGPAGR